MSGFDINKLVMNSLMEGDEGTFEEEGGGGNLKNIDTVKKGDKTATIQHDKDNDEFVVQMWSNGDYKGDKKFDSEDKARKKAKEFTGDNNDDDDDDTQEESYIQVSQDRINEAAVPLAAAIAAKRTNQMKS